jgi:hypothetical protein
MSRTITTSEPVARFSAPPADRMAGRQQARAARAAVKPQGNYTPKQKISAATENRVNSFLSGEQMIDQAIHQGVIGANMASHYRALWLADPAETHKYLVSLGLIQDSDWKDEPYGGNPDPTPGKIVQASASDEYDASALSKAERDRIAAAREGRTSRVISGGL